MSDKRLIDANALYDTITDVSNSVGHDVMAVEDVHHCIDKAPTIDAVEVVRCRECKHTVLPHFYPTVDADTHRVCCMMGRIVPCDGFCYKGKKMDGGAK